MTLNYSPISTAGTAEEFYSRTMESKDRNKTDLLDSMISLIPKPLKYYLAIINHKGQSIRQITLIFFD